MTIKFAEPTNWCLYIITTLLVVIAIRLILSTLKYLTEKSRHPSENLRYWKIFRGFGVDNNNNNGGNDERRAVDDYFLPAILGGLELIVYPILLASGVPEYIGLWLGLKVAPIFGSWTSHRETYQRFLIGNALNLILSYVLATYFFGC